MSYQFNLSGSAVSTPASGVPSGDPIVQVAFNETIFLKNELVQSIDLTDDNPKSVSLGSLGAAHVILLRASGGKVRARLTSTDGAQQAVPVDPFYAEMSSAVGVTALDLTRVAGTPNTVTIKVYLGEKS